MISEGLPVLAEQSVGIFAWDQARALRDAGVEVVFLVLDCRSFRKWRRWGFRSSVQEGIPVFEMHVPMGPIPSAPFYALSQWAFSRLYQKSVQAAGQPDVLHAHFLPMAISALHQARNSSVPLVVTEHSSQVLQGMLDSYTCRLAQTSYSESKAVLAVSHALAVAIKGQFGIPEVKVLPNIVDLSLFTYQPRLKKLGTTRIISAGNLVQSKRHDLSILAVAELCKEHPGLQLTICGDGPEMPRLKALIKQLGVTDLVILTGHLSRGEMGKQFAEADFFMLPSSYETFGLVYVEAMACGLPVIATKCGGPEDFVSLRNGLMIEVDNLEELKDAIVYMIGHHQEYDRQQLSFDVKSHFAPGTVCEKLMSVYQQLSFPDDRKDKV